MRDSWSGIDERLRAVEDAMASLADRLGRLEGQPESRTSIAGVETPAIHPRRLDYPPILSLIGRTSVVFGGAFLLRALTESGRLPSAGGVAVGLAYAFFWLGLADRSGRRHPLSGLFHGMSAVLIALPILWEASQRFHLLTPTSDAVALGVLTTLALFVAWHRAFQILAALTVVGVVGTTIALVVMSGAMLPFSLLVLAVSYAAWWTSDARQWSWLRWPAALVAVLMVTALAARAGIAPLNQSPWLLIFTAAALGVGVPAMLAVRVITRRRPLDTFAFVLTVLALAAGIAAARAAASSISPGALNWVDGSVMLLAALAYGAALRVGAANTPDAGLFSYCSAVALLLGVWTAGFVLSGLSRDVSLTLLAIACGWYGRRPKHSAWALHGAVYAIAAVISTGLIAQAVTAPFALAGAAMVLMIRGPDASSTVARALVILRLTLVIVSIACLDAWLVRAVGPSFAGIPADPGRLAALKSIVIAGTAAVLCFVRRDSLIPESRWLVFPLLIAGGMKLLIEDFRFASPGMLFLIFAAYGAALILGARR